MSIRKKSNTPVNIPEKWERSSKAVKAVQLAFDLEEKVQKKIRREACLQDVSPTSLIRQILKLPISSPPKRPRLTISLTPEDNAILAQRYELNQSDTLSIRHKMMEQLVAYTKKIRQ